MPTAQDIQEIQKAKTVAAPFISFIVTAYNIPPKMLQQCIGSILALSLTGEQREIIVVDDGSEEPVIGKLLDFADEIIYIRQRNQGLSEARNTGLRIARGRYIQFVDGDDCLLQAQYEHCLDLLRYHQPADMVIFNAASNARPPMSTDFDGPMTGAAYMLANNLHGAAWGYMFSRILLGDLRFTAGIFHEDEEFTPQLVLRATSLFTTSAEAYYYRKRHGSIMHDKGRAHKDKRLEDLLGIILRLQDVKDNLAGDDKRKALERRISQLTMDYLYNVIKLTRSRNRLKKAKTILAQHGLYPLPDKKYTLKYSLFRKLI